MLGQIAIIALAIFNQFNIITPEDNRDVFLGQFIGFNDSYTGIVRGAKLDIYRDNPYYRNKPEKLPRRTAEEDIDLNAVAALAMDADADFILFEKNSAKRMPIASLSKIMTAAVVLEGSSADEEVVISQNAMRVFGDKKGLMAGEKIRLEDLLRLMIVDSNNAAAVALAEHRAGSVENFVVLMNEKARKLGLKNTMFVNPTGLDSAEGNNYSTAYDVVQLADYALKDNLIWESSRMREVAVSSIDKKQRHSAKNTNELLWKRNNVYGGKTGYTVNAGECLLLVSEIPSSSHKIISVVLNAENRFAEMGRLADWIERTYKWQ